jgi:hypothetical protein
MTIVIKFTLYWQIITYKSNGPSICELHLVKLNINGGLVLSSTVGKPRFSKSLWYKQFSYITIYPSWQAPLGVCLPHTPNDNLPLAYHQVQTVSSSQGKTCQLECHERLHSTWNHLPRYGGGSIHPHTYPEERIVIENITR